VAYIRFAAVYRKFQDVEEFVNELKHDEFKQFKINAPTNLPSHTHKDEQL